ncbi:MAG: TetR/AcrR family transcriptional regulator [Silvibacterium sp.]|jgi:AcrR family transcriptional regulator
METYPRPFYISENDAPAKQKILVAALEMFVKDGLCETSIRDIAKATGFTNPALFKHFASKDALAAYLFERCYLELSHMVQAAVGSGKTFQERRRALVKAYLIALDRDPDSVIFVQDWLRHFWPKMPAEVRRHSILGEIRALLASGRREGAVTKEIDLDLLATAWVGILQQFARARYFGEFRQDPNRLARRLDKLLTKLAEA